MATKKTTAKKTVKAPAVKKVKTFKADPGPLGKTMPTVETLDEVCARVAAANREAYRLG